LYEELINPGNARNLGPGGTMGLRLVLLGLKKIALVALKDLEGHEEILQVLKDLGIVIDDPEEQNGL